MNLVNKRLLLFSFILVLLISLVKTINYVQKDRTPFYWDQATHMIFASQYDSLLRNHRYFDFATTYKFYPPLTYTLYIPFLRVFGLTKLSALFFNYVYIIVTTIIVFYLVNKVSEFKSALLSTSLIFVALISTSFTTINKWPVGYLWELMTEIPLACTILIFFTYYRYILVRNKINACALFILIFSAAAVLLTKGTGLIFILFPLIYSFYKFHKKNALLGILFLLLLLLANYWYIYNFTAEFEEAYFRNIFTGIYVKHDVQGVEGLFYYFYSFIQTLRVLSVMILPAIYLFIKNRRVHTILIVDRTILLSFVFAFIAISLSPNKDMRYIHSLVMVSIFFIGWYIGQWTSYFQTLVLFSFVIIVAVIRLTFLSPVPSMNKYVLNYMPVSMNSETENTKYYFFQDDSPFFNYANLEWFYERNHLIELNMINRNSIDAVPETIGNCNFSDTFDLYVYSYFPYERNYPRHHVTPSTYCNNFDNNNCISRSIISSTETEEKLTILSCKNGNTLPK